MRIISECKYSKREYAHYLKIDPDFKNHIKKKLTIGFANELFKNIKINEGYETPTSFNLMNQDEPSVVFEYDAFIMNSDTFKELVEFLKSQGLRRDTIHGIMEFFERPL
jgi:hypothetical protein